MLSLMGFIGSCIHFPFGTTTLWVPEDPTIFWAFPNFTVAITAYLACFGVIYLLLFGKTIIKRIYKGTAHLYNLVKHGSN